MIAKFTIDETEYKELQEKGFFIFPRIDEDPDQYFGLDWLAKQYKERLNLQEDVKHVCVAEQYEADMLMADTLWYTVTMDIPEGNYMLLRLDVYHTLLSSWFFSKNEEDYDQIEAELGDYFKSRFLEDLNYEKREQNWLRAFDPDFKTDEAWSDNLIVPYIHKIELDWITDVVQFNGTNWEKWLGDNKIDPLTYPPLEGFGDSLKIGDKFSIVSDNEVHVLLGWEDDDGMIVLYTKNGDSHCSFAAASECFTSSFKKLDS